MAEPGPSSPEATMVVESAASGESPRARRKRRDDVPLAGSRLGRYLVIEELGRGAMGLVLRAYDPKLQREVALKKVHAGRLGAETRARMIREARAMARLAHPNVVAVFDVEVGADSGVVLVMEYVAGITLADWLDAKSRRWSEIVEAFAAAGRGLQAAHTEGLLHRDFKPNNVLVGEDQRVRVMDFGLARTTSDHSSADPSPETTLANIPLADNVATSLTAAGSVMGTPLYMAPEQHIGAELDARADQYAFCVALWRALTGTQPFRGKDYESLVKAKFTGPPRWPSKVAVPRHVAEAIRRGLAPQADERWPSMQDLLAELLRDPSRARSRVLALGAVVVAGLGVWGWQRLQHTRAVEACNAEGARIEQTWSTARADQIAAAFAETGLGYAPEAWVRARERVAAYAEQWRQARVAVCTTADVEHSQSAELSEAARTCLDEQHDKLGVLLDQFEQPDLGVIQRASTATAWLPQVDECTDEARLRVRPALPTDPELREQAAALQAQLSRAALFRALGRYDESRQLAEAVLEAAQASEAIAPLGAEAKLHIARALDAVGKHEEASGLLQDAYIEASALGRDDVALESGIVLVFVYGARLGLPKEAFLWGRLTQMIADRLGRTDDIIVAGLYDGLGQAHTAKGELEEAIALHHRALAIQERDLGPVHPQVAISLMSLALAHLRRHDYTESAKYAERALAVREKVLGPEHPHLAGSLSSLADAYRHIGRLDEAVPLYERSLEISVQGYGPDNPRVAPIYNGLGELHRKRGDFEAALEAYQRCRELVEKTFGPEHSATATVVDNLGLTHRGLGDLDESVALHERALAIRRKTLGDEHPEVADSLHHLGEVLLEQGERDRAVEALEEALAIREKADVSEADREAARTALARARGTNDPSPP